MDSPAARMLQLLSLFASRPRWTATELAERLEVTPRTVRRDVARLRQLGYPVEADAGRAGGYQLGINGRLPPLLLSDDEAVAVAVGLRAAAVGGIADHDEAALSAMNKLDQVLPPPLRERVRALHGASVLVHRDVEVLTDPQVLLTVAQACREHERIRFAFRRAGEAPVQRRSEPYGLVCFDRRWYAVVWDLDRDDWRTFRADRISEVERTGHRFEPRAAPDIEATVMAAIASYPYPIRAEVVLRVPLEEAERLVRPSTGTIEPHDDGVLLRIGGDDLEWIARYLVWIGCPFEVVSPPELRHELRRLGQELLSGTAGR
jgi:predicted DNA-binding transcriptional regulator YafY